MCVDSSKIGSSKKKSLEENNDHNREEELKESSSSSLEVVESLRASNNKGMDYLMTSTSYGLPIFVFDSRILEIEKGVTHNRSNEGTIKKRLMMD